MSSNAPFTRDPDLCVITCAVTGVLANRKQCAGIPYSAVEIAEECKRAYDAGAAVVHIHARQEDGTPTFDPKVFANIKAEVVKRCPILLNFSTGTVLEDVTEAAGLLSLNPTQAARWLDYNGDGKLDLFIGNESQRGDRLRCELYRNNGDGTFTECGDESGFGIIGFVKGVAVADYDGDNRPDIYLSRLDGANLRRFTRPAVEAAAAISRRLGWNDNAARKEGIR